MDGKLAGSYLRDCRRPFKSGPLKDSKGNKQQPFAALGGGVP
jgi:hypothetical protein